MRILWFTNTPCSADELLGNKLNKGGWLKSLEQAITKEKEIDLHIAFFSKVSLNSFEHNNTTYHPIHIKQKGSKASRFITRFSGAVFNKKTDQIQLIKSIAQKVNPDVIHIHGTEENFGLIQTYVTCPCIISIQGLLSPYLEKFYAGIPERTARKFSGIKKRVAFNSPAHFYKSMRLNARREQKILKQAKHILGRTEWDRNVCSILSPEGKYYVGNEILRTSFYDEKNSWRKTAFDPVIKLVTISSEALYKGFESILKTASILKQNGVNFEWQVIGLSPENESVFIAERWLDLNHKHLNVHLRGPKNEVEIAAILNSADIYCQVSHIENSPNSLCEAMLMGMPVIASYAGGTSSLMDHLKEGIFYQDGDPYALAGAVKNLSENFTLAKILGTNARQRAQARHDEKTIVNDLINTYRTVKYA